MDEITTLARNEGASITTQRAAITRDLLTTDLEQRSLLKEYVAKLMVDGTDFGVIPGTNKPTLLKPGAEKLVDLFRCTPKFALVRVEEDFERGFFNYMFRCRLTQRDTGTVLAEGFGSANSHEGRYRWRDGKRKCPECGSEALLKSKDRPEFFCWAKKGGCGGKFPASDERITGQQIGKVVNDDIATLANTILKMAKKRALVDGAIALARCSDMFTQDVEDFEEPPMERHVPPRPPVPETRAPQAKAAPQRATPPPPPPEPEPQTVPDIDEAEALGIAIDETDTLQALRNVGAKVAEATKAGRITDAQRKALGVTYQSRLNAINRGIR